jgi:hypothetical protein
MPLGPSFTVHIEKKLNGSFGDTMNDIRAWLDHRKIQPALFKPADHGAGFEIAFKSEDEARNFERQFGDLIRPTGLPV